MMAPWTSIQQCFALLCLLAAGVLLWLPRHPAFTQAAQSAAYVKTYVVDSPPATTAMTSGGSIELPVPVDSPELVVSLSDRKLYVYRHGQIQATYAVAVGMPDWPTPTGRFQVQTMQVHPTWQHPITGELVPPGPDNPLGYRWIGFWTNAEVAIGFHGTNQVDLIGQAVSHGCIRLRNEDIQALYEQITVGTVVIVRA